MRSGPKPSVRPFNASGYEILDQDLLTRGELVIWSINPGPPRVGDLYTVQSGGALHEVEVDEVKTFERGWSAHCKLFGLAA
jgi:hypothetical protein